MSERLEKVIDIATAVAGLVGASDIAKLLTDPSKLQLGINRLTEEKLLPDPRKSKPEDLLSSGLLLPFYQVIPFKFRNDELGDYLSWCGQFDTRLAVRLVSGDSGRGKTRLMVELAGELRDNGPVLPGYTDSIWTSGFVDLSKLQQATQSGGGNPYEVPFTANQNLCIIVDYAENKPDEVTQLLKAAVAAIDNGRKDLIRIILIARQRTEIFNTMLRDQALTHRAAAEILDIPLKPVTDPKAFYQDACEALSVPKGGRAFPLGLESEEPDCGLLSLAALLAAKEETGVTGGRRKFSKKFWSMKSDTGKVLHEVTAFQIFFLSAKHMKSWPPT